METARCSSSLRSSSSSRALPGSRSCASERAFRAAFAGLDPERIAGVLRDRRRAAAGRCRASFATGRRSRRRSQTRGRRSSFRTASTHSSGRSLPAPRGQTSLPRRAAGVDPRVGGAREGARRRGFRFVGPTVAYAFMQSAGLVDDHLAGCHAECRSRHQVTSPVTWSVSALGGRGGGAACEQLVPRAELDAGASSRSRRGHARGRRSTPSPQYVDPQHSALPE